MRFSNDGLNGIGLYFADSSQYSNTYAYNVPGTNYKQMFICLVLVGDSTQKGGGKGVRMPPHKVGSEIERYDSINNGEGGHYIIYGEL